MRQAGVLAAAGLIALERMTKRLSEDHANAKLLARGVAALPGLAFDADSVQTNIVIFDVTPLGVTTDQLSDELKRRGILANGVDDQRMRLVTHHDVTTADCELAMSVITEVVSALVYFDRAAG
jgi:threonine aldolase